jgi:hypothetical protein
MKTPKVRLYIRVRVGPGQYSFAEPVWNKNRSPRGGYAHVKGQPEYHPEGLYYLRFSPREQASTGAHQRSPAPA